MLTTAKKLKFRAPTVEDAAWAAPLLRSCGYRACEYSFTTIFMWRNYYQNEIARCGDTLFIRSGETEPVYLLPVGGDLREGIALLREYAHEKGEPLLLFGADEERKGQIEGWFPGVFDWQPSENDFDYLYNTEDLVNLAGKKYHGKRNHIAAFSAANKWQYEPLTDENAGEVMEMVREWCRERGNCSDPGLKSERCAVKESLGNRDALSLKGGLIRGGGNGLKDVANAIRAAGDGGKVVAMTLGSPISDEVFDVHVEKALPAYGTAYAVINREFAAHEILGRYALINRENDLGIEGLRRAKRSYQPVQILEKYLGTERC